MYYKSPFSGLIFGQFGQWISPKSGSHHLSDYTRWIGCRHRIGIELEFNQEIDIALFGGRYSYSEAVAKLNSRYDLELKKLDKNANIPYPIKLTHSQELQVLWDCTNPIGFRNQVLAFGRAIGSQGHFLLGSIHVNVQMKHCQYYSFHWGNMNVHTDVIEDFPTQGSLIGRVENKYGPSTITAEELLAKLFVAVAFLPRNYNRALKLAKSLDVDLEKKLPIMIGSCQNYLQGMARYHGL